MSEDVEKTILEVIRTAGKNEDAEAYFNQLKESGRYLKDVY
jgi:sulfite reductase alpha subunit-like flavoprotein